MLRKILLLIPIVLFSIALTAERANASDPSLSVAVSAREERVEVILHNNGDAPVKNPLIAIEFQNNHWQQSLNGDLSPGMRRSVFFNVTFPEKSGSYPLLTTVQFEHFGEAISLLDAGYFNFKEAPRLDIQCPLHDLALTEALTLSMPRFDGVHSRLFAPAGLITSESAGPAGEHTYSITNQSVKSQSVLRIFSIHEKVLADGRRETRVCPIELRNVRTMRGLLGLPPTAYLICALAGFAFAFIVFKRANADEPHTPHQIAAIRAAFSVGVISLIAYAHLVAHLLPDTLLYKVPSPNHEDGNILFFCFNAARSLLLWLYFSGNNYDIFVQYILDPLLIYMIFGNWYVMRRYIRPVPATDKYWQLMLSLFSLIPFQNRDRYRERYSNERYGTGLHWNRLSKIAALSLTVKTFYFPVFSTWCVRYLLMGYQMLTNLKWTFNSINDTFVHFLILLDVVIFSFAYLVELPALKNQIKSVEPTLFGWVICLMCYPPFNQFAIVQLDIPLTSIFSFAPYDGFRASYANSMAYIQTAVLSMITLLWIVYVWASVALGAKASNLTNRGIVERGPYRYVRHPAYTAKILVWLLTSLFLGGMNFLYAIILGAVYALRAWTEERHLNADPDYLRYKAKVRWIFIPGIY